MTLEKKVISETVSEEDKIDITNASDLSDSWQLQKKTISNHYLLLTGKQGRFSLSFYLGVKTLDEFTEIQGVLVNERERVGVTLIGDKQGEEMLLHEITTKRGSQVTNKTWSLKKEVDRRWQVKSSSFRGALSLREISPPSNKKFKFQGSDIHPQVIGLLFETINGHPIAIDINHYQNRPFTKEGEWRKAHLEYGYVRYRVLTNEGASWVLETERSERVSSIPYRDIIHLVWIKNYMVIFQVIDSNSFQGRLVIKDTKVDILNYQKKVTGSGLLQYIDKIDDSFSIPSSFFSSSYKGSGNINRETLSKWCEACDHAILSIHYDVVKNHMSIKKMDLVRGEMRKNENPLESSFQKMIQEYGEKGKTEIKSVEMQNFIKTWLKRIM